MRGDGRQQVGRSQEIDDLLRNEIAHLSFLQGQHGDFLSLLKG